MITDKNSVVLVALSKRDQAIYSSFFDVLEVFFEDDLDEVIAANEISDTFLSQSLLAVIVPDLNGKRMEALQHWLNDAKLEDIPVLQHNAVLYRQLLLIANRLKRSSRLYIDTTLQLAELRQTHEDLQNAYTCLRDHLSDTSQIGPKIIFYNPIDSDALIFDKGTQVLEQRLPIDTQSCCGISLHLRERVSSLSDGLLVAELLSPDDPSFLISWEIQYSKLSPGWTTFAFEQKKSSARKSTSLRLSYKTRCGEGPRFSFGYKQVREDRAAVIDGALAQRSIALKVWGSVRGARLTTTTQMWPAFFPDKHNSYRIDVCIDSALEVFHLTKASTCCAFPVVVKDLDRRRILVHPLGWEPTIAKICQICPPGTSEIRAEILTDHELASPVEYAILPMMPGSQPLDFRADENLDVDWHLSLPSVATTIRYRLQRPTDKDMDLLLLTRVPVGYTSDYCWAHFQAIAVEGMFL